MSIKIDKDEFQAIVNLLEDKNTFNSRTALWKAVENTAWARSQVPTALKWATAANKAEQMDLTIKTPARETTKPDVPLIIASEFPTLIVPEPPKPTIIKNLRKKPVKFCKNKMVVPKNDLRRAVRDKCMDCSGNNRENVASCHVKSCPLYAVRPYKLDSASKETENV